MILVDTSIWIDHLRAGDPRLAVLLAGGAVLIHPAVIGELSLGSLSRRAEVIGLLSGLPRSAVASDVEVAHLIEHQRLFGRGIGYVDAHLLAAVLITPGARLWTRDKRLSAVALALGVADGPHPPASSTP